MTRLTRLLSISSIRFTLAALTLMTAYPASPNLALAQFSEFHTFIGKATLDGSKPPAGTEVTAFDGTRPIGTGLTAANGTYALQASRANGTIIFKVGGVEAEETFPS